MEKKIHQTMAQPKGSEEPNIAKGQEASVKAAHLSSNPDKESASHSHFEVEVYNAFFRVFNIY